MKMFKIKNQKYSSHALEELERMIKKEKKIVWYSFLKREVESFEGVFLAPNDEVDTIIDYIDKREQELKNVDEQIKDMYRVGDVLFRLSYSSDCDFTQVNLFIEKYYGNFMFPEIMEELKEKLDYEELDQ